MTTTHHQHPNNIRIAQVGQAVERLLDAIAGSPDYQEHGSVTYMSAPRSRGRWHAENHRCGIGAITTAASNGLITVEETSPTAKTLTLTREGRRHVRVRQNRRLVEVMEGEVTTTRLCDINPDGAGKTFTVEASVMVMDERCTPNSGDAWPLLTLDDGTAYLKAWLNPHRYQQVGRDLLMPSETRLHFTGCLVISEGEPYLIVLDVQRCKEADAR